jgi:hypothetical protein
MNRRRRKMYQDCTASSAAFLAKAFMQRVPVSNLPAVSNLPKKQEEELLPPPAAAAVQVAVVLQQSTELKSNSFGNCEGSPIKIVLGTFFVVDYFGGGLISHF